VGERGRKKGVDSMAGMWSVRVGETEGAGVSWGGGRGGGGGGSDIGGGGGGRKG